MNKKAFLLLPLITFLISSCDMNSNIVINYDKEETISSGKITYYGKVVQKSEQIVLDNLSLVLDEVVDSLDIYLPDELDYFDEVKKENHSYPVVNVGNRLYSTTNIPFYVEISANNLYAKALTINFNIGKNLEKISMSSSGSFIFYNIKQDGKETVEMNYKVNYIVDSSNNYLISDADGYLYTRNADGSQSETKGNIDYGKR